MMTVILSLAAIAAYLLAAASVYRALTSDTPGQHGRLVNLSLGVAGLFAHALVLFPAMVTAGGLNLNLSSSASLVTWIIAAIFIVSLLRKPVDNLAIFIWPLAALAVATAWLSPGTHVLPADAPLGLEAHVGLSIVAYSLLTIACLQALVLAFADRRLRARKPALILQVLPPLVTMEEFLFEVITVGFVLLTLGLATGFAFVDDFLAQHLLHKTVLSCIGWLVFAVLLGGRLLLGWRGRIAIRWTVAGFVVLALAFFGSKFVLEVLLQRV